jgi:hypothetical protein
MKYLFVFLIFLYACNTASDVSENKDSPIQNCLTERFSDYFENEELILDIFNADNVLIDMKVGFSQAFRQLNTAEIGHYDLTDKEWDRLSFID